MPINLDLEEGTLLIIVENVSRSLDTGKIGVRCFLDLIKTMDTVNHQILLDKLFSTWIKK